MGNGGIGPVFLGRLELRAEKVEKKKKGVDKDYEKKNLQILISNGNDDPTFDESILNVFSPQNENAISMLSPIEWKIVQMRLGLLKGEEGIKTKPDFIADILGLSVEVVEKSFKRAKRILSKHLINIKG